MEESKVEKTNCQKFPVQKGDYVVKEIKMLSTDTRKELYYMGDNDNTLEGDNIEGKANKKLKLKAVKTIYSCRKCDYSTTNRGLLPLHKCNKNDQNNDTDKTQNVDTLTNCNIQNTNYNMQISSHNNLTTNSTMAGNTNKNFINNNMQNTNYIIQIPSHNNLTTNSTMVVNTNTNIINSDMQNTNANDKKLSRKKMKAMYKQELLKEILKDLSETDKIDAFNCTICKYACKTLKAFNLHMDSHYNSENNLKCSKCIYIGRNMVDLKRHYDEAFKHKCHCGYDIHKKYNNVPHKNIHNVTMIVLPEFFE